MCFQNLIYVCSAYWQFLMQEQSVRKMQSSQLSRIVCETHTFGLNLTPEL